MANITDFKGSVRAMSIQDQELTPRKSKINYFNLNSSFEEMDVNLDDVFESTYDQSVHFHI